MIRKKMDLKVSEAVRKKSLQKSGLNPQFRKTL
jgi:hypothetical protein